MEETVSKTFACPHCKKHVTFSGKPGKKYVVECPHCHSKGFISFLEVDSAKQRSPHRRIRVKTIPFFQNKYFVCMKKKKKLLSYSIVSLFSFLFIVFVLIPALMGSLHFLIVLSGSMQPAINPGDVVVTSATDINSIHVGDVITFKQPSVKDSNECVTHRVFNISYDDGIQLQTKGDANENPDITLVNSSNFIGKVVFVIPDLGYLPGFVQSPLGFVLLFILPGSLLMVGELKKIITSGKKEEG